MSGGPVIDKIARFVLVVSSLEASASFFAEALGFTPRGEADSEPALSVLLGIPDVRLRQATMTCGEQEVVLLACDPPGSPYPVDSTSTDLWFQHFAIIVSDMDAAYDMLERDGRFTPISEGGPVQLPEASGGVRAFKFRDLDGHPLELLAFRPGAAPQAWASNEKLHLGIDHSAVSVGDTSVSVRFFEEGFGLKVGPRTENEGPEQARMDDVPDARVTVTGMMPRNAPPHVELLGYKVGSRRPIDGGTRSSDLAATQFVLRSPALDDVVEALTAARAVFVSPGIVALSGGRRAIAVLDPDGHRFIVEDN